MYGRHYSVARLQLMEVHVGKGPAVKKGSGQLPYNSKQRFRTVPALCIQPTNAASNAYIYLNLITGKKIVSHVATPRAYDDETRALIKDLDGSSVNSTSPTSLAETEITTNPETGVPPTITDLESTPTSQPDVAIEIHQAPPRRLAAVADDDDDYRLGWRKVAHYKDDRRPRHSPSTPNL